MKTPPGIPEDVWRRLNPEAKKTLMSKGPPQQGREAVRSAIITLASELRVRDVPKHAALAAARSMPFRAKSKQRRAIQREIPQWVTYAYEKEHALLSGCPTISPRPSKMRDSFAAFCDDACKATCLIRRARLAPEMVLADSPYYPTALSPIWLSDRQHGLSSNTKRLWTVMASMAVLEETPLIQCAMAYVLRRYRGATSLSSLYRYAQRLRDARLIELVSRSRGIYRIPIFTATQLRQLEEQLGVRDAAAWNIQDAEYSTERRNERFGEWDVTEEIRYGIGDGPDESPSPARSGPFVAFPTLSRDAAS